MSTPKILRLNGPNLWLSHSFEVFTNWVIASWEYTQIENGQKHQKHPNGPPTPIGKILGKPPLLKRKHGWENTSNSLFVESEHLQSI